MNKDFFSYLQEYSHDPRLVNRMIVSNFLYFNDIDSCTNLLIEDLRIKNEDEDYAEFQKIVSLHTVLNIEDLIHLFEFVLSPKEKIVSGAVYTPVYIRNYIIHNALSEIEDVNGLKICDPACGCSGFLLTASKLLKRHSNSSFADIFKNNLYGLDIQKFSIDRSKILLSLAAIVDGEDEEEFEFNLFIGNALNFDWSSHIEKFRGFNSIVGNPPYVCSRNIEDESKSLIMKWSVSQSGHPDLYIPFFEIGISNLIAGGDLGFITMNTFFKSVNGRALREYFHKNGYLLKIIDFGAIQVFNSKSTYTCICFISKIESAHLNYVRLNKLDSLFEDKIIFKQILYKELNNEQGWNLQEREILNKIENIGTSLGKKFTSRNGIATLKNNVFIFKPVKEDENFFYLRKGGSLYPIERTICFEVINPNKLTRLDSLETLRKKIIFPYYFENNSAKIIPESEFLNSFPNAYKYLLNQKAELFKRDKGKGSKYDVWYAYGRKQSLEPYPLKMFFPHITSQIPNYIINEEPNLLFVNGLAIISDKERELLCLRKIMSSRLFWFYIVNSSKPYGSGYYSLSRNYIKNFGIYNFSEHEVDELLNLSSSSEVDLFLEYLYNIDLSGFELVGYQNDLELAQ